VADEIAGKNEGLAHLSVPHDWELRRVRAEVLQGEGRECAVCGGTGGWPGLGKFVGCRPCLGSGTSPS